MRESIGVGSSRGPRRRVLSGLARNCSRRKKKAVFSRQDDARDERGLGRMESEPTGKAGGDGTYDGIEAPSRSLRVLEKLGRSVHSIENRHIRRQEIRTFLTI